MLSNILIDLGLLGTGILVGIGMTVYVGLKTNKCDKENQTAN